MLPIGSSNRRLSRDAAAELRLANLWNDAGFELHIVKL
jgi:hypothetical protein